MVRASVAQLASVAHLPTKQASPNPSRARIHASRANPIRANRASE